MTLKVRRGLGLLVVAVLAFLVTAYAQSVASSDNVTLQAVSLVAIVVGGLALVGGLVMVAWGLLRD